MAEKENKERYTEGAIPTQTAPVIVDTSKKLEDETRILTTETALAKILNKLETIEKALVS